MSETEDYDKSATPTAHALDGTTYHSTPSDITNLDATTLVHGLMPKLDKVKIDGIEAGATKYPDTGEEVYSSAEKTKLTGIEAGATKYPDTGEQAFLDADHTKLDGIEAGATKYPDTGEEVYSSTEKTKLTGIETGADVTDSVNVGSSINGVADKNPPIDADKIPLVDTAASNVLKTSTWTNIKAFLKTYFDTLYALLAGRSGGQTLIGGTEVTDILKLQGTSGNGTATSPAVEFLVGNNGATIATYVFNDGKISIGTANPYVSNKDTTVPKFVFVNQGVAATAQFIRHTTPGGGGAILKLSSTRGTDATDYTIVQNGDGIGTFSFAASDGTQYIVGGWIIVMVDGTPGVNSMPSRMVFGTTPSGAYQALERLRINSSGQVSINTTTAAEFLTVAGRVRSTTSDIVVETNTRGLILKDTQATPHYWRITVSTLGVLTTTDLGTSLPAE